MSSENLNITIVGNNNNSNLVLDSSNTKIGEISKTEVETNNTEKKCTCGEDVSPEKCKIIEELYNSAVLGKSCCSDPSQLWCSALKTLDSKAMKQYIYDAPDFNSAIERFEKAYNVWYNISPPVRVTRFVTPLLASALPYLQDKTNVMPQNIVNSTKEAIKSGYNEEAIATGVNEEFTRIIIFLDNFQDGGNYFYATTETLYFNNNGRIVNLGETSDSEYDNIFYNRIIDGKLAPPFLYNEIKDSNPPLVIGSYYSDGIIFEPPKIQYIDNEYQRQYIPEDYINKVFAISELPDKIISSLKNIDPNFLTSDPLLVASRYNKDSTLLLTFTNNVFSIILQISNKPPLPSIDPINNDNILAVITEPLSGFVRSITTDIEDFKEIVNLTREFMEYPLVKW